jgi:hypothetical protein
MIGNDRARTVAALFCRADSVYKTMPWVDAFDAARDARTWLGGGPVVAHPPCKRWSSLNNLVLVRYPHRAVEFAHGNDGGMFELALRNVRTWGGVLEHPAQSRAWQRFDLPAPARGFWQRGICGGWCIELDQAAFGHPARKRTWLYAFGLDDPPPPPPPPATASGKVVRPSRKRLPDGSWKKSEHNREVSKKVAEHTPAHFADWLVGLARRCQVRP